MSKHLRRDLDALKLQIRDMGEAVVQTVDKAGKGLLLGSVLLARQVVASDEGIDTMENRLTEECLKVLALHQPVAVDLRTITATMSLAGKFERIADLAVHVAQRTLELAKTAAAPALPGDLHEMVPLVVTSVREALECFLMFDAGHARRVIRTDPDIDRLNHRIGRRLVEVMRGGGDLIEPGLAMHAAARHLERIADHAAHIAEEVVYLVEGEIVRHRMVEGEE